MSKSVTIYTTSTCAYCHPVKDFLKQKNVSYDEVNLDQYPERRQELLQISGQFAVPVTVVTGDDSRREVVVGFNLPKLAAAVQ